MIIISAVVALTNSVFTVTPSSCPSCPYRMRFSADGRSAAVNMARVDEKDYKALSARAFALMEKAAGVAESWRTTGDIRANWDSIRGIIAENLYLAPYASLGHYNDMDMLQVGRYAGEVKNPICETRSACSTAQEGCRRSTPCWSRG